MAADFPLHGSTPPGAGARVGHRCPVPVTVPMPMPEAPCLAGSGTAPLRRLADAYTGSDKSTAPRCPACQLLHEKQGLDHEFHGSPRFASANDQGGEAVPVPALMPVTAS